LKHTTLYKLLFFRLGLISLLLIISYLAFTPIYHHPEVDTGYDKINHFVAFLILALFCNFSFPNKSIIHLTILPLCFYAVFIEVVQYFLPFRSFSLYDFVADVVALLFYLWLSRYFSKKAYS